MNTVTKIEVVATKHDSLETLVGDLVKVQATSMQSFSDDVRAFGLVNMHFADSTDDLMALMTGYANSVSDSGLKARLLEAGLKDFARLMRRAQKLLVLVVLGDADNAKGQPLNAGNVAEKRAMVHLKKLKVKGYAKSNASKTEVQIEKKRDADSVKREKEKAASDKVQAALCKALKGSSKFKVADYKKFAAKLAAHWSIEIK